MPKSLMALAAAFAAIFSIGVLSSHANAADVSMHRGTGGGFGAGTVCQELERCGPKGCHLYRVCGPPCPDGYSCSSLYGAYGPYGGQSYWGAYTDAGWRSYRQINP